MTAVVTACGVTKQFGSNRGVRDVSLELRPGEIFGFLGPNGAGKSTTIRLLLGLYLADQGRIRVFGRDPRLDSVQINRRVGYLPGELALFPRLIGRQHLDRAAHARGLASTEYRDELVERLDAEIDRPVRVLSKGNRQKLGLILALMHRPDLLLLDEPTSGLDPLMQAEFAQLVRSHAEHGACVLLSSHELDEVQRLADRLAIIKDGQIIITDTVAGLRHVAARTMTVRFPCPVDTTRLASLKGVANLRADGAEATFSVSGQLAPILRAIADLDPVDVTARPADLEELFLRFYRAEPTGGQQR